MCRAILIVAALWFASAANAQDARALCPARPGLGIPPCIVDAGKTLVEVSAAEFTHDAQTDMITDTLIAGDLLLRIGLADRSEIQFGWTAFGTVREDDRKARGTTRSTGIGDLVVALKQSLANPDGSGWSAAIQPYVSLPIGGAAIGAGDWGTGLLVPFAWSLANGVSLQLTPQVEAAVDEDRDGRHLAFGSVAGVEFDITDAVSIAVEGSAVRHRDPAGHSTEVLGSTSVGWTLGDDLQLDAGSVVGLNRDSADLQVYIGISRRF